MGSLNHRPRPLARIGWPGARGILVRGRGGDYRPAKQTPTTMWRLCKNFLVFLNEEKKWWLIPLVILLLLLAAVFVLTGNSVLAPFMYPVR